MKKIKLRTKFSYLSSLKPISVEKAHHDYFNAFIKSKFDIEKRLAVSLNEASVLIIGCGYKYPDVLLFSYFAKEVYGLDVVDTFYRDGFWALYRSLRRKGKTIFFAFLKAFVDRNGLHRNYYKQISMISNLPESNCIRYPWGHLRGIYKADIPSLNKATTEQISRSFSSEFIIDDIYQVSKDHSKKGIDKTFTHEGQNWLTENIRNELKQYTDEQLLTRSYLIIGRKQ